MWMAIGPGNINMRANLRLFPGSTNQGHEHPKENTSRTRVGTPLRRQLRTCQASERRLHRCRLIDKGRQRRIIWPAWSDPCPAEAKDCRYFLCGIWGKSDCSENQIGSIKDRFKWVQFFYLLRFSSFDSSIESIVRFHCEIPQFESKGLSIHPF